MKFCRDFPSEFTIVDRLLSRLVNCEFIKNNLTPSTDHLTPELKVCCLSFVRLSDCQIIPSLSSLSIDHLTSELKVCCLPV